MTRDDFKRIPELRREINKAFILWENALESATRTTTVITGMPKGNITSSQVESAIVKAETYHEKYDSLCEELRAIFRLFDIESKLKLNETETEILRMYYQQSKKMAQIAKEKEITERHAYRIKKEALKKICR